MAISWGKKKSQQGTVSFGEYSLNSSKNNYFRNCILAQEFHVLFGYMNNITLGGKPYVSQGTHAVCEKQCQQ